MELLLNRENKSNVNKTNSTALNDCQVWNFSFYVVDIWHSENYERATFWQF